MSIGKLMSEDCDHLQCQQVQQECFKAEDNMTYYLPINQHQQRLQLQVLAKLAIWHYYYHQNTTIFTYWNSMESYGREKDPQVSVTCLWHCSICCGYDGKAPRYSSFMVWQATWWTSHNKPCTWLHLQHTWITLTILKYHPLQATHLQTYQHCLK